MDVVNLADKFRGFSEAWSPRIVGDLNDMHVKVVKPAFVPKFFSKKTSPAAFLNSKRVATTCGPVPAVFNR